VERRGARSVVARCRGAIPLAPRLLAQAPAGFAGVGLVQTAGGPLGGDAVTIDVDVGPGAALLLRTIAATVVLPGDGPAVQAVRIRLGRQARLVYAAEPVIVAAGAHYRAEVRLDLELGAGALVRESIVRGRHAEPGGAVETSLRCDLDGQPVLRDAVRIASGDLTADSAAVLGGARAYGAMALCGLRAATEDPDACRLAAPGAVLRALAPDAATLAARLAPTAAAWEAALVDSAWPAPATSKRSSGSAVALAMRSMSAGAASS
jgi:urease accessory protein